MRFRNFISILASIVYCVHLNIAEAAESPKEEKFFATQCGKFVGLTIYPKGKISGSYDSKGEFSQAEFSFQSDIKSAKVEKFLMHFLEGGEYIKENMKYTEFQQIYYHNRRLCISRNAEGEILKIEVK